MKKILSIDGGGIRGIIPATVLYNLEKKLQKAFEKTEGFKDREVRLSDFFDFFAGTSTGGILCCIYLCPDPKEPSRSKYSAEEALNFYLDHGQRIFDRSALQRVKSVDGIADEKYSANALEELLKEKFADTLLSDLTKPCIITAYDIYERKAHFFAKQDGIRKDFKLHDVARATSAAPTYFEAAKIYSIIADPETKKLSTGIPYALIDGGIFANNPALCAYSEVRNAKGDSKAKDDKGQKVKGPTAGNMFIVSLGTGSVNQPYEYNKAKDWGKIDWVQPAIDIMMSGAAEITHYTLKKMFSAINKPKNYIRIQPDDFRGASTDMDDATPENIKLLHEVGMVTARDCDETLNSIVNFMLKEKIDGLIPDTLNFGQ